jgi:hypothetical protein
MSRTSYVAIITLEALKQTPSPQPSPQRARETNRSPSPPGEKVPEGRMRGSEARCLRASYRYG